MSKPVVTRYVPQLPDGWVKCPRFGDPRFFEGLNIIPCKVPLSRRFDSQVGPSGRWTLVDAIRQFRGYGMEVATVIDLTKSRNYYDFNREMEQLDYPPINYIKDEHTALHGASWQGHTEVVAALLAAGAEVNARAENEQTALHSASRQGRTEVVTALLAAGAEVNARTKDGVTALHSASEGGQTEVVVALLAAGAEVKARDKWGMTALQEARRMRHTRVVELLEEHGGEC